MILSYQVYVVVVMWKFGLHVMGMVQGPMLQLTLVPGVGVSGWMRASQFLLDSYGKKFKPRITGQSKVSQTMNCWWNF